MGRPGGKLKALFKTIVAAANVVLAVFTVFSAYGGMINPADTSIGAIAAMLFPAALSVTVVFAVFTLLWSWKISFANILVIIVCWGPVMTICPFNFFRPDPASVAENGGEVLKVVTFNTYGLDDVDPDTLRDYNRSLKFMIDADADILLCQELYVEYLSDAKGVTEAQKEELYKVYPYRNLDGRGMCIFSKYPFTKVPLHYTDSYKFDVCRYDVEVAGRTVHVFNLHLQSIGLTPSDKRLYRHITEGDTPEDLSEIRHDLLGKLSVAFCERAKQAEVVRSAVDDVTGDVIVAGDFNDIPGCYASRVIASDDLTDVYRSAGFGPQITYHADRFYFRIDQMYCRGALRPLRARCGGTDSSDHYPLTAWFEIEK